MTLGDKALEAIKQQYANIWTNIIGEDPPEIFTSKDEKEAE